MRWDALFADMEAQLAAAEGRDRADEVAELTRAERASVLLTERLRAGIGSSVTVTVRSGEVARGVLTDVGSAWVLVADGAREHLVPVAAVVSVAGLGEHAAPDPGAVVRGLGLGPALRAVARDRRIVRVVTVGGSAHGRIDAVGADHLDLALTLEDSGRPTGRRLTVTFAGLDLVGGLSA